MDYDMPVMTKRVKCYLYSVGIWSNEGMKYLELNDGSQEQEQEQDNVPFFRVYASKGSETETTFFLDGVITIGRVQNGLRLLDGKNKEDRSKGFSSLEKKRLSSDTELYRTPYMCEHTNHEGVRTLTINHYHPKKL
ncbi:uncharacterized protein LOC113329068 isoform X3 [Papaver somniferum]|uniref:uncharacterized protein LOC113329068 isoform X3 n=1 Tax=Papaver somniferum TaxID=3469 RepID=UPI000E6F5335|nr:uncharacterized protein LOC113329068 isoform X3 [Papaver somniferum]